jgi:acyl-CoA thioester hydrolase
MYTTEIVLRIPYPDVDRMGFVYHANYLKYFEMGRTDSLRTLGFTYRELEDMGILMPVVNMNIRFHKAALYDDEIKVKTTIKELPAVRHTFFHEIRNQKNELLTEAECLLVYLDQKRMRPIHCPDFLLDLMKPHWRP